MLAIHQLDALIVEPLVKWMEEQGMEHRILLLSDHKTLMSTRTHDGDPVPYMIYDSTVSAGSGLSYTEANGEKGPYIAQGVDLMKALFQR